MKSKRDLKIREDELYDEMPPDGDDPIIRGKLDAIGFILGETDCITELDMPPPTTNDELDHLILVLEEEKKAIAEYSLFGDPNWKVFDAQIAVCKWAKGE